MYDPVAVALCCTSKYGVCGAVLYYGRLVARRLCAVFFRACARFILRVRVAAVAVGAVVSVCFVRNDDGGESDVCWTARRRRLAGCDRADLVVDERSSDQQRSGR